MQFLAAATIQQDRNRTLPLASGNYIRFNVLILMGYNHNIPTQ